MAIWRPVPAIHGDDMRPVPKALVGDDMVTTNEPSQPEYAWPPRHVVIVAGRVQPGPVRAGSRRAGLAPTPGDPSRRWCW